MELTIKKVNKFSESDCLVLIGNEKTNWKKFGLSAQEAEYVSKEFSKKKNTVVINQYNRCLYIVKPDAKKTEWQSDEEARKTGDKILTCVNSIKAENITVVDAGTFHKYALLFVEGMALGNYQFLKYRTERVKEKNSLKNIRVLSAKIADKQLETLSILVDATHRARTLVNEPVLYLTAVQLSKEFEKMGKEAGFNVEVFNKAKIVSMKMGGLLAVNAGSPDPPTFSIMEYKPKNAKNKKPYVLIGKGVVYDTGGLSLKPTANSMDYMKSDMAGAAAVASTIYAIAKAKLPLHVIALVPSTDNRPGGNAITPGDVIEMYSGKSVEILNTDAEGRLILGDALAFAKKYDPALVIDLATLTGAAVAAIGTFGIVCMGTADEKMKNKLKESSYNVYERLAEFPFWDEYDELIKSDIADIKNIGGPYGGAITAGKFLEHFIDYPWMHFDIAGPSFLNKNDSYRGKGGTGVGVRLLFDFFSNLS